MYNQTAGWVRWTPPPSQHHNGNLYGYKIEVSAGNTMKVLANMTLNATTTSVLLNNLTTGAVYSVRLNSFTKAGDGPYSKPVSLFFIYLICALSYTLKFYRYHSSWTPPIMCIRHEPIPAALTMADMRARMSRITTMAIYPPATSILPLIERPLITYLGPG